MKGKKLKRTFGSLEVDKDSVLALRGGQWTHQSGSNMESNFSEGLYQY